MSEHVTTWLEAYHDGELTGRRRDQVERHLATCPSCRAELDSLRSLTTLLQESPAAVGLQSPERFIAQVGLRLESRPTQPPARRALKAGWRLVPFALCGAWAFVQTVFIMSGLVMLAWRAGIGQVLPATLPAVPDPGSWSNLVPQLPSLADASLSSLGQLLVDTISRGGPLGWESLLGLAVLSIISVLYCSWLASWWVRRQGARSNA